jgi:hypothetical protein
MYVLQMIHSLGWHGSTQMHPSARWHSDESVRFVARRATLIGGWVAGHQKGMQSEEISPYFSHALVHHLSLAPFQPFLPTHTPASPEFYHFLVTPSSYSASVSLHHTPFLPPEGVFEQANAMTVTCDILGTCSKPIFTSAGGVSMFKASSHIPWSFSSSSSLLSLNKKIGRLTWLAAQSFLTTSQLPMADQFTNQPAANESIY